MSAVTANLLENGAVQATAPRLLRLPRYGGKQGMGLFRAMTAAEARQLPHGSRQWFVGLDGSARQAKITSVKTWKRHPEWLQIRVKYGLYEYGIVELKRLLVEVCE